jgi:TolA-binding protein
MKKLGKIDESGNIFETMRYQGKFKDKLDRILIELGQIYYEKKQAQKALIIFKDVDTTYRLTQSGGIAGMKIAKIYEKEYRDYDSSYKYYNKVSVANVPKDVKIEADKELKTITNYFALKSQQKEYNQQITYRNKPQYFYQDSVDYSTIFRQYQDRITKMTDSLKNSDSQKGLLAQNYTFDQVGKMYIQQQDDLKRRKTGSQKYIDSPIYLVATGIYKKPQKLKISSDSLQIMISQNLYNIGDLFYSELEAPDSAYSYFKKILKDYPNKPVTSQAMFALGIYYETNRDSVKADSLFKYVYNNFVKDPIRIEAGRKLGLIKKEDENFSSMKRDTVEKAYAEAEQLAYDKKYLESIKSFQNIYTNSPKSKYAAKSIYYCGLIYEENLKMYDSAAVEYGLLQNKEYVNSAQAKAVSEKYLVYITEKEKLKAESDKIKKETAQKEALNQQKVNPDSQKSVQDINQKSGTNIPAETIESKSKDIKQSEVKDSPLKTDSLKMLNQKAPLPIPKSIPNRLKMQKDTTKKFVDPL